MQSLTNFSYSLPLSKSLAKIHWDLCLDEDDEVLLTRKEIYCLLYLRDIVSLPTHLSLPVCFRSFYHSSTAMPSVGSGDVTIYPMVLFDN